MPIPLPLELRRRVVESYIKGEGTFQEIGKRFRVARDSVYRWTKLQKCHGVLSPKPYGTGSRPKLDEADLERLRLLVSERPDRTVSELCAEWNSRYEVRVSRATIGRALLRASLPFKKRLFAR